MEKNEIYKMLTTTDDAKDIAVWLRQSFFPEIIRRFNSDDSRKRFGLYQNEKVPINERNLADVRTRMGVLIEFELARISNELLPEVGINDIFWSYVVANRFPDLEVRNNSGDRHLRLEIKCLQCIAEEKSAKFDTLKKDINPLTDFVIVCLWDWSKNTSDTCNWDSVPLVYKVYVFHAYSLAMLRDTYWLNNPPSNLGNGFQGFDVRYAVTCSNGVYSKEQGNYGKLTRIWKDGFEFRPVETEELIDTEQEYLAFQKEIIFEGFKILANNHLSELLSDNDISLENVYWSGTHVGYNAGGYVYILSSKIGRQKEKQKLLTIATDNNARVIVLMTEKYRSTVYSVRGEELRQIVRDEKPKNILRFIHRL